MSGVRASSIRIESTSSTIGEIEGPLDEIRQPELHVVPKIIEAEFVVCPVGDVGAIGGLAIRVGHVVLDRPDRQAEKAVDRAHPFRVPLGQVIIDGDDVDAPSGQGVEVGGEGGDERFSFARLHLGDLALVEDDAADQLDIEVPHPGRPSGSLPDDGESFGQEVVQGRALGELFLEFGGFRPERIIA